MTETTALPARGWRSRRIRLFLLVASLVLLVAYVGVDLWSGHQLNLTIAELEKRYGRLDERSLDLAPVPASDNRARVVRAAAALTVFAPGTTSSGFALVYGRFLSPASRSVSPELRDFVEANRAAIRVADDAGRRRQSNWEAEYAHAHNTPPYLDIRMLSNAIYLAALMDVEAGRPDDAAKTSAIGLVVTSSLRQEPDLITQLIRIAMGVQQFEAIHRLMSQFEPSKASLEELAKWLAENRTPDPMDVALLSEVKRFSVTFRRAESGDLTGPNDASFWLGLRERIGRPLIRLIHLRYLQQAGHLLDIQLGPRPRQAPPAPAAPEGWAWVRKFDNFFATAGLGRATESGDLFNTELGATELAVALRRFRLDHGSYPDDLSALVPMYVASVPIDAFTGRPPVYARQGAGFQLHAQGGQHLPGSMVSALNWNVLK